MHLRFVVLLFLLLCAGAAAYAQAPSAERSMPVATRPGCLTPQLLQQNRSVQTSREARPGRARNDSDGAAADLAHLEPRETRQRNLVTSGGHFRIHYDQTGRNAVAARDLDANAVPDYIGSDPAGGYIPRVSNGLTLGYYRFTGLSPYYCVTPISNGANAVSAVGNNDEPASPSPRLPGQTESRSKPTIFLRQP